MDNVDIASVTSIIQMMGSEAIWAQVERAANQMDDNKEVFPAWNQEIETYVVMNTHLSN